MKITYIVPGFGGKFYCGNCLRDSSVVKALNKNGHDAFTLPLYLPHSFEDFFKQNEVPVFFGAVNIYLKQNVKFLRGMPNWMYRFFNSPAILKFAAKKSGSTRAAGLEDMTISMLNGSEGFQSDELEELIDFLKHKEKPDIVHLSNALLMGLAARIKEELKIPVVCSLQDEDVWINAMRKNYIGKLWNLMTEKAKDIDMFFSASKYFAEKMQSFMKISDSKIKVVPLGVDSNNYTVFEPKTNPPTIGFLSRMNKSNGFEILIDAFIKLKQTSNFSDAKLKITGGKTADDDGFIKKQIRKLEKHKIENDIEFIEYTETKHLDIFFNTLSILSVPVIDGEAFGLYQLEALASGIPIVQPNLGAFKEIVEETKAGAVYSPNNSLALCKKWIEILSDENQLKTMSENGVKAISGKYNTIELAKKISAIYDSIIEN
ncbi:MAG: glycosyltransferase family 4 protein [Bacteroidetes bacterium]|jgi:glycosyltransferase involved in cell wall biosynthesis|nr:glycosyltransferase family 4 protein [Bacteroidota bacterium]MBT6684886.1 glycosyltransferase family 4 protein [Bacteroidota bacterium]MBT7141690.1 glycosyltransferase family 4 protein [Bacteroidota bacterium]MBT7492790.1 glycosyltransferase family 4 protein [Bacteroidota bacterium]